MQKFCYLIPDMDFTTTIFTDNRYAGYNNLNNNSNSRFNLVSLLFFVYITKTKDNEFLWFFFSVVFCENSNPLIHKWKY
ncbi:unnamed protein product [Rotaria magnacalcarata]